MSRKHSFRARELAVFLAVISVVGCTEGPIAADHYPEASELYDSKRCAACHPTHYDEWSASMHAYAAEDPVFLAMNRRGQEETNGALGPLCVNCHAPLAVRAGLTTDGLNLADVPETMRGVTCYFCHNVEGVDGAHNNPLRLSDDVTMRARIENPKRNGFHRSASSPFLSGEKVESAAMCGSCHDIVLPSPPAPAAVPLERTYTEWLGSVFAPERAPTASSVSTCTSCHMPAQSSDQPIAPGGPNRTRHSHHLSGVDGPLTPFPNSGSSDRDTELGTAQADDRQALLDPTIRIEICLQELAPATDGEPGRAAVYLTIDNANAGHNFPSGASQDRRAWTEVIAYSGDQVIYQSGVLADGETATVDADPDLWLLRDKTFDSNGNETHMFWTVADHDDKTAPVQITTDPSSGDYYKTHVRRRFPFATDESMPGVPDRVSVRMRILPIGLEVLDELIASGHLDPTHRDSMKALDLLPFRNDFFRPSSGLSGLNTVTMEWSEASRAAAQFVARDDFTQHPEWKCVGMPRKPR